MMKTTFLVCLLISNISCYTFSNRYSRVRRSLAQENLDQHRPDPQLSSFGKDDHKKLRGLLEQPSKGKLETIYFFIEEWLQKGNVTLVGWQNVEDEDGNTVVRTIEFTLEHGDAPLIQSEIVKNLEYESITELSDDIVNVHRRLQSESGMKLLGSFEKYYRDGILDAKLYIDYRDSFYSEDNEINNLKRNLTVKTYSEAKELTKQLRGTYDKVNIIVIDKDDEFLPQYSQIVPELMAAVSEQEGATLEQMEAALKYSARGYLIHTDTILEYVGEKFHKKFPEYIWHVVNGSPYTYMNKDVTIKVDLIEEVYTLSIFGNKI